MTSSFVMWTWHSNIVMSHVQCLIYMIHLCRRLAFFFCFVFLVLDDWSVCFVIKQKTTKTSGGRCLTDISERSLDNGCGLSRSLRSLYENGVPDGDWWWTLTILLLGDGDASQPTPNLTRPHSKHPAICHFHLSCALQKTKWLIKIRKKRARAHGCTFPRSLLLDFIKMIKYHYWNLKKCHTVKNPLKWERT